MIVTNSIGFEHLVYELKWLGGPHSCSATAVSSTGYFKKFHYDNQIPNYWLTSWLAGLETLLTVGHYCMRSF